jgi:hypothetical protein
LRKEQREKVLEEMKKRHSYKKEKEEEKPEMDRKVKGVPEEKFSLKHSFLSSRHDLFREPFLNIFRHIGSYVPKFAIPRVPAHNPQESPNNFSRVYTVIEPKLLVHSSYKLLFFEFFGLILRVQPS